MRKPRHPFVCFSLPCLLAGALMVIGCSDNAATSSSLPTTSLQMMIDAKVKGSTAVPGVLVAVKRGDQQWIGVSGEADTATHAPVQPGMKFRVGSLTKQFTAALILKLAEEGRLSLDDTLRHWLPDLQVPNDDKITLRMLLNHTSGVPSYTTATFWDDLVFANPYRAWQPSELIQEAKKTASTTPPADFAYCNTGYILAGMIAEAASGESASQAMATRFFTPLEMHDTQLAVGGALSGSYAHGYLKLPGHTTVDDVSDWNPSSGWTAGSIVTTAHDMLLWDDALFGGKVLSAASLEAMLTPVAPSTEYGLGLGLKQAADGRTFIYHSGMIPGYSAITARHRESGLSILILTNREDISTESNDIITPIFEEVLKRLP